MSDFIQRTTGKTRWHILPDWEQILLGPEGLRLAEWREAGRVDLVKRGDHRTVYCVHLDGRSFYVKHDHPVGPLRALQHLVRASAARRECRRALQIARRGVRTVRPVAWAETSTAGLVRESFLVTEAIECCGSVEQFALRDLPTIAEPEQRPARRSLLVGFAHFMACVHRSGIRHNDFHAGNVLVTFKDRSRSDDARPTLEFFLIDVPKVRLSGPLSWPASRAGLAMVLAAWRDRTTRAEQLLFWRTYLVLRPELRAPDWRAALAELDHAAREHSRRLRRSRDKRSLRANRDYQVVNDRRARVHGVHDVPMPVLERLAGNPECLLWENLHHPVKISHNGIMVEASLPTCRGPTPIIYKCYRPRNWWKAFCGMFHGGRALRSWYLGQAVYERNIPTARPLAVCTPRQPRFGRKTYVATERIAGAENLHLYGWKVARRQPAERARRADQCAQSLGKLVGRMHAWGVRHGDLKGSNILVVERERTVETFVIDMDGVELSRRAPPGGYLSDLGRLATSLHAHPWVSRTVCCRFLRAYARQFPPGEADWKDLWRKSQLASNRLVRRKRRRKEVVL